MPYHEARKTFNKDEIIDILKKNVALFKSEPEFVNYIVDLAMYLIECHYNKEVDLMSEDTDEENKVKTVPLTSNTASQIYKVFRSYAPTDTEKHCHLCGAPTYGKRKCPNCGNMT